MRHAEVRLNLAAGATFLTGTPTRRAALTMRTADARDRPLHQRRVVGHSATPTVVNTSTSRTRRSADEFATHRCSKAACKHTRTTRSPGPTTSDIYTVRVFKKRTILEDLRSAGRRPLGTGSGVFIVF